MFMPWTVFLVLTALILLRLLFYCIVSSLLQCVSCLLCIIFSIIIFVFVCTQLNYNCQQLVYIYICVYVTTLNLHVFICALQQEERLQPIGWRLNYKSNQISAFNGFVGSVLTLLCNKASPENNVRIKGNNYIISITNNFI